jgi:hypothetical protein
MACEVQHEEHKQLKARRQAHKQQANSNRRLQQPSPPISCRGGGFLAAGRSSLTAVSAVFMKLEINFWQL